MFKPIHLSSCILDPNISLFLLPKNWEINIEMQQKQVSDLYLFVHVFTVVINPPLNESAVHPPPPPRPPDPNISPNRDL